MKINKFLSGMLAVTLAASAFAGLTVVNAAANTISKDVVLYENDFENPGDATRGLVYTDITNGPGTVQVETVGTSKMLVQRNTTSLPQNGNGTLMVDFADVNSGVLVVELHRADVAIGNGKAWNADGMFGIYSSSDTKIADIRAAGRGQNGASPWVNGAWYRLSVPGSAPDFLNNVNWMYANTIKYELDFSTGKYKVFQGRNQLQTTISHENEFDLPSGANASYFKYVYSENGQAVDDIKIYKKLSATQTADSYTTIVGGSNVTLFSNADSSALLYSSIMNATDFTYTSSNSSVATIDTNSEISIVNKGTTVITATHKECAELTFTYNISVLEPATGITITGDSYNIYTNQTQQLGYTLTPADGTVTGVTWASSDGSVATVDENGLVTAGSVMGTATITVTATVLSGPSLTDTCTVNVFVPLTGLTISGATNELDIGDSVALSYTPIPSDAVVATTKWRSGNHYVAQVNDSGVVTAVGTGTTEIYLSSGDVYGRYSITVNGVDNDNRTSLISFADVKGSFSDIADMAWAQSAIQNVAASGIMTPDSEYFFGAKRNITRDELVSVVIKTLVLENETADEPVVKTFDDVDESNPYYAEIMKAVELGIIEGINETSFAPKDDITRQDLAVVVFKALEVAGVDIAEGRLDFDDKDSIATYAQKAVRVLSKMNIMVGKNNGNFDPLANTTRAETAVISEKITAIR
ncbi:MAG: S-layer homology domain-containing protein [Clostridia bacterium]|nr:S-layer homology domain-containing protein [Clostridia bacterium]